MKTIDEIEKMSLDDLERIAADESVPVPVGLESRIRPDSGSDIFRSHLAKGLGAAASIALVAGIGFSLYNHNRPLKDTFDDPALAYAMVEETLSTMSIRIISELKNVSDEKDSYICPGAGFDNGPAGTGL